MLTADFQALQEKMTKAIPAEDLRRACGIILLDRTKAGFIFAYEGGGGVAMVKEPNTQRWGPPAFVVAHEASLGFQVGGQHSFVAILIMNTNALRILTEPNYDLGAEAQGTAGDQTARAGAGVAFSDQPVLVYGDTKGLYGGASIKGGDLSPDHDANWTYYGQFLSMQDILFQNKVKPTEAASALAARLAEYSTPPWK
jgi:lipid-binding SYLF domain-containing protein